MDTAIWRTGWFGTGITGPINDTENACYSSRNVRLPRNGGLDLRLSADHAVCHGVTRPYTGALISSNPHDGRSAGGFQYRYGVLQVRMYVPGRGARIADWPAVWADGQRWPADGEDDLMEGLGGSACFHFVSPAGNPGGCAPGIGSGWHTFASEWEPGSVTYYYDGRRVGRITRGVTSSPMYIVLANTVSQDEGSLADPSVVRIADVRVWQRDR